ncbi:MAG: permease [Candidatus Krumholzibacteriota bacterium]|nr:permease [Candidatus Krumholzibacteriota bacterium]
MDWKKEWKTMVIGLAVFAACFYLPVEAIRGWARLNTAFWESLQLIRWYAREHVILCLVPAFFIAGAIAVFISQASVMKYLGYRANKVLAYGVASVSGTILAVCSCTVLPLFAGIYRMGAGLGPACAFLYSGPAINVLAIVLTARVLGLELGIARAVGAVVFSIVIGLSMHFIFRDEEKMKAEARAGSGEPEVTRPLWQNALFFAAMVGVLVFANWGRPAVDEGFWSAVYSAKWVITSIFGLALALMLVVWIRLSLVKVALAAAATAILAMIFKDQPMIAFAVAVAGLSWAAASDSGEGNEWSGQTWGFARQIMPLLLGGVLIAGLLLGRPGHEGLIPASWVSGAVGGNSLFSNFFASLAGAFMYFATLTEVPILQGLIGSGMGKGPALALLLAGPALSLPNMLVIRSVMGTKKTIVFVSLVIVMATITGMIYGAVFGQEV